MTRKPIFDPDDLAGANEVVSRKQVLDALRRGASLADSDLRGVDLSAMNLDGADLRRAKLADANLTRATLRNANLSGASLWHANLKDAVLDGANLEQADLDFANLDGCTVKGCKVKKAIFPHGQRTHDEVNAAIRTGARLHIETPYGADE